MRYELILQPSTPDGSFDALAVEQAADARGAVAEANGARRWKLKSGEIELGRLVDGGKPVALELRIPLSDRTDLMSEALRAAVELAAQCSLRVVDPQLSRGVTEKDEGTVTEQFLRTARYAGEMMGLPEAVAASFSEPHVGMKPGTKVMLGLIALVVVLYFAVDALGRFL